MDSVSTSSTAPDLADDATSSEPPVTRPNPFDDTDLSSRKRRRTSVSASGSPAASLEPALPPPTAYGRVAPNTFMHVAAAVMNLQNNPRSPRTPEQFSIDTPPPEPSSKITINLRGPSVTSSPTSAFVASVPFMDIVSNLPELAEDTEVVIEMTQDSSCTTPRSSTISTTSPIELIAEAEGDDSDDENLHVTAAAPIAAHFTENPLLVFDPTVRFPYAEPGENPFDTAQRLAHYLSQHMPLDATIITQINEWLNEYLNFAAAAPQVTVLASRRAHHHFWCSFPDILFAVTSRRQELVKVPLLRNALVNLYTSFAVLTARFVPLDSLAIRQIEPTLSRPDRRAPDLLVPAYLQQLHSIIGIPSHHVNDGLPDWIQNNLESFVAIKFETSPGGDLDSLFHFVSALAGITPYFPRLADSFAPLSQNLAQRLLDCARTPRTGQQGAARIRDRLEQGYNICSVISTCLLTTIEKHVTSLNSDYVASSIQALTDTLKLSLRSEQGQARDALLRHRNKYPSLDPKYTNEAIVWQWKFDTLAKLICSSQMQLRVMAVTTMCNSLVALWRRHTEGNEELSADFIDHLARYLLKTELVDYILGANCHPEIIVESANIIGFLVVTRTYQPEHTERIWRGITSSQDPRLADAWTRMLTVITNLFDYTGLLHLCSQFQLLPLDKFTPLLRALLENILSELMVKSQADHFTLTFQPYRLCLRLLRESSVCASGSQVADPEMQQVVMQKFRELLGHGPDVDGRRKLYLSCINDVSSKSITTLGSLWCLSMAIRHAAAAQMRLLTEQHDLAKLIVEELEHAVNSGRMAGVHRVLCGTCNQPRRDFVTNLIQLQPEALNNNVGEKLWNIMVGPQSISLADRKAGWHIILSVARKTALQNAFLRTCFTVHLPMLPAPYFCDGMLDVVKEQAHAALRESADDFVFDDQAALANSVIEQLWRIILEAEDPLLVRKAISILAVDIYLESSAIASCPIIRARQIHLTLVNRCLHQMKDAAGRLRRSSVEITAEDDEPMVIIATNEEMKQQEVIFSRSLQLLRLFLEKYQLQPRFAVADLRSFMTEKVQQTEGDSAQLKYQAFDSDEQTDILALKIGKLNTVSSLLATLRKETGFDNYRVYYRGQQLVPEEQDICKSLQEFDIQDGFLLVKREQDFSASPLRIKPGSLPLEIEVLAHFSEFWDYLSMDEKTAEQIFDFVVKLPADGYILSRLDAESTSYKDFFHPRQPFKSLYATHTLSEYVEGVLQSSPKSCRAVALKRLLRLVVQALSDSDVFQGTTPRLQLRVASSLMQKFVQLSQGIIVLEPWPAPRSIDAPKPDRLMEFLSSALNHSDDYTLPLVASTWSAILLVGKIDASFWLRITRSDNFRDLIEKLVLLEPRKAVRTAAVEAIETCVGLDAQSSQAKAVSSLAIALYIWSIVSELLPQAVNLPAQCDELFLLLRKLPFFMMPKLSAHMNLDKLTKQTVRLLLDHVSTEDVSQSEPYDPVARGLTLTVCFCLTTETSLSAWRTLPETIARDLLCRHLFPRRIEQNAAQSVPRVILNTETRRQLYDIIFCLAGRSRDEFGQILHLLNDLVPFYTEDSDDPYHYDLPYQFDRSKAMRSACGYVGLRNLSNTCYLNSLLTQLYMNTGFRRFILEASCHGHLGSQQLLFHTQKVFGYMQESYRPFVDPTSLVNSITTYEDSAIDVNSQMDVDEFYSLLFDRWEGQLAHPEEKRKLWSFYGGQLVQQVKSKECPHISERLEPFAAIHCDIKGKSTLQESLQAYVDGEIMDGDNRYKCSTCDRHVDAVKRACLKHVPDNVIFHLKRFDFNLRTLQRSKINDHFSFPRRIDLRPYTIEHLSDRDANMDDIEDLFELVGILVHSGTAESGHYYSYIKERTLVGDKESWVEFNDDVVKSWDSCLMASSTFGGPDSRLTYETNGMTGDKNYCAYMLFYQRLSAFERAPESVVTHEPPGPLRVPIAVPLKEHIVQDNTLMLRRHCLFDPGHGIFVTRCLIQARLVDEGKWAEAAATGVEDGVQASDHDLQSSAVEMAISHLDQVISRAKDTPLFAELSSKLRGAVNTCAQCGLAVYDYFEARPAAYRALLQRNPEQQVRMFASELLIRAVVRIAQRFPELYKHGSPAADGMELSTDMKSLAREVMAKAKQPIMQGVVDLFNNLWDFFHIHLQSWDEYFSTVLAFAKLGEPEVATILSADYLVRLMRIVAADVTTELEPNYARMLNNVMRRISTRPPSYSAILTLMDYLLAQLEPMLRPEAIVDSPRERARLRPPYPWTLQEVHMVHNHPQGLMVSFFVEKLLLLDQSWKVTGDIVDRLTLTGAVMDQKMLNTLRRGIPGDVSTQPMDPFLRAAGRYMECSPFVEHSQILVRHVAAQAPCLQISEGLAFLDFFRLAMRSEKPNAEVARLRGECSVSVVPSWAPYLLVFQDVVVRRESELLIQEQVLAFSSSAETEEGEKRWKKNREHFDKAVRELGRQCLLHLREAYVKRRQRIGREAAWTILRVIGRCGACFGVKQGDDEDDEIPYEAMQADIMEPLRRLMVEELDEDGSDWDESCVSSEGVAVQTTKELNDTDVM